MRDLTVAEANGVIEEQRKLASGNVFDRSAGYQVLKQFSLVPWEHLVPEKRWELLTGWTFPGLTIELAREIVRLDNEKNR